MSVIELLIKLKYIRDKYIRDNNKDIIIVVGNKQYDLVDIIHDKDNGITYIYTLLK